MADKTSMAPKAADVERIRRKLRPRKPAPSSAIDVDGQVLRIVQTSGGSITRVIARPLEFSADANRADATVLGRAIAATLSNLGLNLGPVMMGIPRHMVVMRTLSLPAIEDERELASMVHFRVGRDLPFRLEEAVIDFTVRGPAVFPTEAGEKKEDQKLEVLVAAVKREAVEFYEQTADAARLKLESLGWLSYANARSLSACRVAEGGEGVALVSLRPDEVSVEVIAGDALLFSRGATMKQHAEAPETESAEPAEAQGGETPPPATYADAATIEVVRSLHSYGGMEPHVNVARVAVTGATGFEGEVVEILKNRISIPCSLLNPAEAMHLPEAAREDAAGSISAIGLALSASDPDGLPFDFLNPKRPPVQRDMRRIRILGGIAAAAATLILFFGARKHFIDERLKVHGALQAELSKEEKNRPLYRRMRQQAAAIREWAGESQNWLEQYAYLSAVLPPSEEIYINSFAVGGPSTIRFAVQARNGETLAKLDKQLRAAGYNVKPLAITPTADKNGYNFRSMVELTLPSAMKIDLAKVNTPARPADDASLDPAVHSRGGGQ
jgi:type IV pilus assembly protein PilM